MTATAESSVGIDQEGAALRSANQQQEPEPTPSGPPPHYRRERIRTRKPVVKRRRDGGYDVLLPCVGSRKNAEKAARVIANLMLAHRQSLKEAGGVRLNELSDVLYTLGLVLDMRPKERA